jgi:hypothetical protein
MRSAAGVLTSGTGIRGEPPACPSSVLDPDPAQRGVVSFLRSPASFLVAVPHECAAPNAVDFPLACAGNAARMSEIVRLPSDQVHHASPSEHKSPLERGRVITAAVFLGSRGGNPPQRGADALDTVSCSASAAARL